ncbi:hypothetical protein LSTR_LSTR013302 [Laodelphax striatellus]|uniref:RRM domain-containing protein n=1 Tax=Laodelphax striatellus TaxID=195883 RepID=A0A482XB56_LAOST|nr:hypothetical protein LSTR_LSTR013302 [Laodelphax striatellus]
MNVIQACSDTSDVSSLFAPNKLYLKPIARLNISVQIPTMKLPGKTISNTEVMDKLKYWAVPDEFITLKVSKSTLEFIRFEAEIESRGKLSAVLARLDGRSIKISGFREALKVRAAEAPPDFPTRHAWDSYFRDAKHMNEMKPGERPDTIKLSNLPCKWFASRTDPSKPSEYILKKVFEQFGEVRCVDIPLVDPYRRRMKSQIAGISMFSHSQSAVFDAFVQFNEYVAFMKAMDALRGMKLVHMEEPGQAFSASIKVDFDKTKHMSDTMIKRRRAEREKLITEDNEREEEERRKAEKAEKEREAERLKLQKEEDDKLQRRREREKKRKLRQLEKMRAKEAQVMNEKIASEERLLIMAQRKLETIRLLGELFKKVEEDAELKLQEKTGSSSKSKAYKGSYTRTQDDIAMLKELEMKQKLVKKLKMEREKKSKSKSSLGSGANPLETSQPILATSSISSNTSSGSSLLSISDGDIEDLLDKDKVLKSQNTNRQNAITNPMAPQQQGGGVGPMHPHFGMAPNQWYHPFDGGRGGGHFGFPFGRMPAHPQMMMDGRGRGFFPRRGRGFRWPRFPQRGRGGFFHPAYMDPSYMDVNQQYFKYFQKLTHGRRSSRSRSRSRSYSRSRSRSRRRSWSSRSSRSRSRSRRRSRSWSHSRSRSRSRSRRSRSRSRSRSSRKHSRSRSRSRSPRKHSKSPRKHSRSRSRSSRKRSRSPRKRGSWSRSSSRSHHRGNSRAWSSHSKSPAADSKVQHQSGSEAKNEKGSSPKAPVQDSISPKPAAVARKSKSRSPSLSRHRSRSWDRTRKSNSDNKVGSNSKLGLADSTTDNQDRAQKPSDNDDTATLNMPAPVNEGTTEKKQHHKKSKGSKKKSKKEKKDRKDKTKSRHDELAEKSEENDKQDASSSNKGERKKVPAVPLKRPKYNVGAGGRETEQGNVGEGSSSEQKSTDEKKRRISPIRFPIESKVVKPHSPSRSRDRRRSSSLERRGNVAERHSDFADRRGNVAEGHGSFAEKHGNVAKRRDNVAKRLEREERTNKRLEPQPLHNRLRTSEKTDSFRSASSRRRR